MRTHLLIALPLLTLFCGIALSCGGDSDASAPAPTPTASPAAAENEEARASKARTWDPSLGTARITGTILWSGPEPRRRKVDMGDTKECTMHHDSDVMDESVIVNGNDTLRNVFVTISKGLKGWQFPTPQEAVVLDQVGCTYEPHVVGLQVGQELRVRNSDQVTHNVHAYAKKNDSFNQGQVKDGADIVRVFEYREVIDVKCDLHGWMSAFVGVSDHPFYAVTGNDGAFDLGLLPEGEYTVKATHEVYGAQKAKITIGADEIATLDFTFADE